MKIGIYLGDIKKPTSVGDLTFELSFVEEILKQKTSHEFVFYYFGQKDIFKNRENAKFVCLKYYKKTVLSLRPFSFKQFKTPLCPLNYILKRDNINVVHFLVPYLFEHIEIPYFATVRDISHRILPHFPEFSSISERLEKKLNQFLICATKIFTPNAMAKKDIKTLYDIIDNNIKVLPLPYPNWIVNVEEDLKILASNGLTKNSYILYPAQFWTHKNHIRLVLASQLIKEQNMNLKVVFCGLDRGNKKYIKKSVEDLDLEQEVLFLDYVSKEELAALYKNAYCAVYPSLARFDSISALEALYFNCPVLISKRTGFEEQLKKAALYFNPLDERDIVEKITALSDIMTKDELVSKGQLLIKENSCENYISKFLNIVDDFYLTRQCWSITESYINK